MSLQLTDVELKKLVAKAMLREGVKPDTAVKVLDRVDDLLLERGIVSKLETHLNTEEK